MPVLAPTNTIFTADGASAKFIAVPDGGSVTVYSNGDTLYYDNASTVTSSSNDGNIATGASASFTTPQWVIAPQNSSTRVTVLGHETVITSDLTVTDDVTVTDAATFSGATVVTPATAPASVANWVPPTATSGTDTAFADGTLFLSSIYVPVKKTLTGVGFLLGSVGGTDKVVVNLWSTAGANLAQSTTTGGGTTAGTAANTQEIAFATAYVANGPAKYYVGVAANGATAKLRTVPAYTSGGIHAGSVAQTHAAVTAITAPTTFTADKAPVLYVY